MSIFRRRRAAETDSSTPEELDTVETTDEAAGEPGYVRSGPWDVSEVDGRGERLDLGALWIPGVEHMELRLEVDPEQQTVVSAAAVMGESVVQLQVFAAPTTFGVWDEIRDEIAASIVKQGGTAQVKAGQFGDELATRMPSQGPDGRTVFAPARFVGVDGPRWFLRAVFSGRAAIDDAAAAPLMAIVRDTVVVRGSAPMAPRELLTLTLPDGGQGAPDDEAEPVGAGLNPFERGPEITEVH